MKTLCLIVLLCLVPFALCVRWVHEPVTGDIPEVRSGSQLVTVGKKGVLFGGMLECFNMSACENYYYDDIHILDYEKNTWTRKTNPTVRPEPRIFHGYAEWKGKAVFFAGVKYSVAVTSLNVYSDMWMYNPSNNQWQQVVYQNAGPGPRIGMEIAIYNNVLYAFGGFTPSFEPTNDMWAFDLEQKTWTLKKANTEAHTSPGPRFIDTYRLDKKEKRIYIFGGNQRDGGQVGSTTQFNDTWYYDIPTNTFVEYVSASRTSIPGRTHTASAIHRDTFVIALGDIPSDGSEGCIVNAPSSGQNPTDTAVAIDISRNSRPNRNWEVVEQGFSPKLKRVASASYQNRLYVTHGFNYVCPTPYSGTPVWNAFTFSLNMNDVLDNR